MPSKKGLLTESLILPPGEHQRFRWGRVTAKVLFILHNSESLSSTEQDRVETGQILLKIETVILREASPVKAHS